MKTTLSVTAIAALLATAPATFAQVWEGSIDAGLWATSRTSTDSNIEEDPFVGTYLGGYASRDFGTLKFAIDGRAEFMDDNDVNDTYESGPLKAGVLGLHLGREYGSTYVGGFAAAGLFSGYDSDHGHMLGLEVEHFLASGGSVYGQLGYAKAIGDEGDNEFKGYNLKVGYQNQITDRVNLGFSLETAYSPNCFEDCGNDQWGRYTAATIEAAYALNPRLDLVGAVSYASIHANDEDSAESANLYLGVRVPFGNKPKSALRTPMGAFHGAGWMYPLD